MEELKIKITTDTANATTSINSFLKITNNLRSNIDLLAHSLQALKLGGDMFGDLIKSSISLNANLEDLHIKLTGLISANTANITSTGAVIDAQQKWALASDTASAVLGSLSDTARNTGINISDLSNAFSMFYATSSNQGSIDKAKAAFESVAYAVKVSGKNMNDLTSMFDSLATGTVIAESEMGAFMQIIGLTNEELKQANQDGKVFDLLIEKTAKFKELSEFSGGSFNSILAQFKNELANLTAELGKPIFESFKNGLASTNEFLKNNHSNLVNLGSAAVSGAKHIGIFVAALYSSRIALSAFNTLSASSKSIINASFGANLLSAANATKALNLALNGLKTTFKTFLPTAIVFTAFEGLMSYFSNAKKASDELQKSLNLTSKELKNLSQNQLDNELIKAKSQLGDLYKSRRDINLERKAFGLKEKSSEEKIAAKAEFDEYSKNIDLLRAKIKELELAKKGIFKNDEFGELVANPTTQNAAQNATKITQKNIQDELKLRLEYYKAIGDKENERRVQNEITTNHLKQLGLNNLQIQKYLADEEASYQANKELQMLKSKERYYELLGDKAKAASVANQIQSLQMQQSGDFSNEEIANSVYGKERQNDNYNTLYSQMGYEDNEALKFQLRLDQIDEFQAGELERIENHYALLEQNAQNHAAKQVEIERAKMQSIMSASGAGFDMLGSLAQSFYTLSGNQNKDAMRAYQALMVGKAIVNTYTAATNAYASSGNPYLGAAMAAVAIAQGMAQVAMIKAQKFHTGGFVSGLGNDEVPAILQTGEGVLSRKGMANLDTLNLGQARDDDGGVTIINSFDNNVFEQWATSRTGRKTLKNIIN